MHEHWQAGRVLTKAQGLTMMKKLAPGLPAKVAFEARDCGVFGIPDARTKLETLQRYFFPRLDAVLAQACQTVTEALGYQPLERMTVQRRPRQRPPGRAQQVQPHDDVHVGLTPQKAPGKRTVNAQGRAYQWGPSMLLFELDRRGALQVRFVPFCWADRPFRKQVAAIAADSADLLKLVGERYRIRAEVWDADTSIWCCLEDSWLAGAYVTWAGPLWRFPLQSGPWLDQLVEEYVALYPLLEATTALALGEPVALSKDLEAFLQWAVTREPSAERTDDAETPAADLEVPEDDPYRVIRPGLWYQVLQRDRWRCVSCGRTVADGVLLEVDHIQPRSLGGTNAAANLQTLCRKCNSGKSNRDATDLRAAPPVDGGQ